jgi:hypothetical protein
VVPGTGSSGSPPPTDPGIFKPTAFEIEADEVDQIDPNIYIGAAPTGSISGSPDPNDSALINRGTSTSGGATICPKVERPDGDLPRCES